MDNLKRNQGIVRLNIGNKEVIKKNTITKLGDAYFSAKSKQNIAIIRGIEEGFDFIQSNLSKVITYVSTGRMEIANKNDNLTLYLLNLIQPELDALTADSTILPIFTQGTFEIDHNKIVGWASMDRVSAQAKQGIFSTRNSETVLDEFMSSLAWEWAAGKTVGTSFNCIAIGYNLVNIDSNRYSGMSIYRGLEPNDVINGESVAGGYLLRPGVTGITGQNEILLGGRTSADYSLGRVKYDMISKTPTELKPGDVEYDFPLSKSDKPQVIIGNRLFYFKDGSNYLHYYDMATGTHTQSSISVFSSYQKTMFSYNGYLYTYYNATTLRAYNPLTLANVSASNIAIASLNLPVDFYTTLSFAIISIGEHNNGYLITYSDTTKKAAMIRADLLSSNTVVGILPKISSVVNYTINNQSVYFDYNTPDDIYKDLTIDESKINGFGTNGVKYSKYTGNLISFLKYTEPQTIASDDVITVEYAYKYGV